MAVHLRSSVVWGAQQGGGNGDVKALVVAHPWGAGVGGALAAAPVLVGWWGVTIG